MIPTLNNDNIFGKELEIANENSYTYKISKIKDGVRVKNYVDELEAVKQAIFLILSTERYKYPIFSWDYGIELDDLFGREKEFVIPELPRRISEALIQDDRISEVSDFSFSVNKNVYSVSFTVSTIFGKIQTSKEVVL